MTDGRTLVRSWTGDLLEKADVESVFAALFAGFQLLYKYLPDNNISEQYEIAKTHKLPLIIRLDKALVINRSSLIVTPLPNLYKTPPERYLSAIVL